jgi:hypothetical protein
MLKKLTLILLFLTPTLSQAQGGDFGFEIILTPGDSLRQAGEMYAAIDAYKKSIAPGYHYPPGDNSIERSVYLADAYNLVCALARTGQSDSAIKYLTRYTAESKDSIGEALGDPDLYSLRKAGGWTAIENKSIRNYSSKSKVLIKDLEYAKMLWYLKAADQAYYKDIEIAETKTGKSSSVVLALWDLKKVINEDNQRQLELAIKTKGWPKISEVGAASASAAFLVIQHASLEKQQKYLPVIEGLCKTGEARWQDYALMYDRVQISNNKPQRYGSQVSYNAKTQQYELLPLEDATKVDEWRKDAGLQPLAKYLTNWKITWPAN